MSYINAEETYKLIEDAAGLTVLNQGNTAEVYAYGEHKILKLFREGMPEEAITAEFQKASVIQEAIENVPKAFEIVRYHKRLGIVYERIRGKDLLNVMLRNWYRLNSYSRLLARLHFQMHQNEIDVGYGVKEKLSGEIRSAGDLPDADKDKVLQYLERLPDGGKLCHFDFHPGNIMMKEASPVIIDWMTACTGCPEADVARTYLMLQYGEMPYLNRMLRNAVRFLKGHIGRVYYEEYKKISGATDEAITRWLLPVAAARLMEWIPENERKKLLAFINAKLRSL